MNKSDTSFLFTVFFFTIGFLGFLLSAQQPMNLIWYACLAAGVLLFIFRIARGDD
jgi:hypothetical protein